jgi:hypothetical protein
MSVKDIRHKDVDWIHAAHDTDQLGTLMNTAVNLEVFINYWEHLG